MGTSCNRLKYTLCAALLTFSLGAIAQVSETQPQAAASSPDGQWSLLMSPYAVHFSPKPTHRPVYLIGMEKGFAKSQASFIGLNYDFYGLSYFSNSFGQPSLYAYAGRTFRPLDEQRFFVKLSAGLIYGYKGEFKDQAGKNYGGFTPVIIPSFGWQYDNKHAFQVNVLGTAGAMFMLSRQLD